MGRIQRDVVSMRATLQRDVVFEQTSCPGNGSHGVGLLPAAVSNRVTSPVMSTTGGELPRDWWTTDDVVAFLESQGAPISPATWRSYVSRGQAPAPARTFGRSPAWRPAVVREWQASRPRRGSAEA